MESEEPEAAARREFSEELGAPAPDGELLSLGSAKQSSGKVVYAWALESDFDTKHVTSNTFEMAWPPKSGQMQEFPEVDKAGWFSLAEASNKLVKGQVALLETLAEKLGQSIEDDSNSESVQTSLL